ncbi:phosphotransferase family protein [Patescibacteria group bacterium]
MRDFKSAAKQALPKRVKIENTLKILLSQPDRAIFLAEESKLVLKVYKDKNALEKEYLMAQKAQKMDIPVPEMMGLDVGNLTVLVMKYVNGSPLTSNNVKAALEAGKYLELFHSIDTVLPFSGGQNSWDEFILWWSGKELQKIKQLDIFGGTEILEIENELRDLLPTLVSRPIVTLHGDLQAEHILVDAQHDRVLAFLDFVDSQPGDPLLDIAVLSLWDNKLADLILESYKGIENSTKTQNLLVGYRLLRHLAVIPWLSERGRQKQAEKSAVAIRTHLLEK